jgi:CRISPR/Cas system-associated exonuclease Cas4 (RecB family)|tara:strand:- start:2236 stop:2373 length:138 start_codon:yes stop_codon:yes gene_type:complete
MGKVTVEVDLSEEKVQQIIDMFEEIRDTLVEIKAEKKKGKKGDKG